MEREELDDILSRTENIVPSRDFITGVMAAVQQEASAPPPIPFPWKRVVPGLAVGVGALVAFLVALIVPATREPVSLAAPDMLSVLGTIVDAARAVELGWLALALVLVVVSVRFSMRLVGARA